MKFLINTILNLFVINSPNKNNLKKFATLFLRFFVKKKFVMPFLINYVSSSLILLGKKSKNKNALRLLVLNEERYKDDLLVLSNRPDVELLLIPSSLQHLINAIWLHGIRNITLKNPNAYLKNENKKIKKSRKDLHNFLKKFIFLLSKKNNISGLTTCTFYYRQDREWESACREINIPFFVIQKENMMDPVTHKATIKRYLSKNFVFNGHKLFLLNKLIKKVIFEAGCAKENQIEVTGGLRMDTLFNNIKNLQYNRKLIVLFSTHHVLGLLQVPSANGLFVTNRKEGFVNHFTYLHGYFAKSALQNPTQKFVIKTKFSNIWHDEIRKAIKDIVGVEADKITNLTITSSIPAQELMLKAKVVIGLNSTTLLESKLANVPVILPLFKEAKKKYFKTHIFFQKYLNIFTIVYKPSDILKLINEVINGYKLKQKKMPKNMIYNYIGYFDGKVADRIVSKMRDEIKNVRAKV